MNQQRRMNKRQAVKEFRGQWQEAVAHNPRLANDRPALVEAWNNYTDMLCKERRISETQYNNWVNPF